MKHSIAAAALVVAGLAHAQPAMTEGEVRKVEPESGKLTLKHGGIRNLDMPAMTMVFRVRDPAWLNRLQPGDKVSFAAEKVDGQITITALTPGK